MLLVHECVMAVCEVGHRYLPCSKGILDIHIADMESKGAEREIYVCIGGCSKSKKRNKGRRTRRQQQQLLNFVIELQRKQDVMFTEIVTKLYEEGDDEDIVLGADINSTDYYHDLRNLYSSGFIFVHESCSGFKDLFQNGNALCTSCTNF